MSSRGFLPGFGASGFEPLRVMGSPSPPSHERQTHPSFQRKSEPLPVVSQVFWAVAQGMGCSHLSTQPVKGLGHTCPAGSPSSGAGLWVLSVEGPCSLQKGRRGFAGAKKCSPAWEGGGRGLQRTKGRPEQVLPADSLNPGTRGLIREGLPEQEPAG